MDSWGALRYATTTAFLAGLYADWSGCSAEKAAIYKEFAKKQVDYALGSAGRSFVVGFGTNPPTRPHHRTAHSSWADSQTVPTYHRHTIYGALVGGPGNNDSYTDDIGNYVNNEIACDYNAGFIGALTKAYKQYGGTPIAGFKAIETKTNDEFFVEAGINASGPNFIEIKALLNNRSGWPAKVGDKLSFKYFIDITEAVNAGYTASNMTVSTNYNSGATVSQLLPWDASKNIYYVNVDFTGTKIYPGGQSAYKKEIQFRIAGPQNTSFWNNANDFSFTGIGSATSGTVVQTLYIPVYDNSVKVYGNEPDSGTPVNNSTINPTTAAFDRNVSKQADVLVTMTLNGNTLNGIKNGTVALVSGSDYTVSGSTVTILKSYLAKQAVGTANLTFDFSAGVDPVLAVTVTDTTPSSSISPTTAAFDKNEAKQSDIIVTMTLNGNTLSGIKNGAAVLVADTDYTVSGSTVTILKSYLAKQAVGTTNLTFDFSAGIDPVLAVTVTDTTPSASISPTTATFDKSTSKQTDIAVAITPNGNTLNGIKNGTAALVSGTDYAVSGNTVTILKGYLAKQAVGTTSLTFDFSAGVDPVLTVSVVDTSGSIKIQMFNGNTAATTNGISPRFKLVNTGNAAVKLSDVKLRYYYTVDGEKAQNFWCDWSTIGSANVTGTFVKLPTAKTGTDYYLEIGFTSGAGNLAAGQSIEVQARFAKADWTNYTQTGDYSFDATDTSYVDWNKATAHLAGSLVWGVEP